MNFCKNLIGAILLLFLGACSTSKRSHLFSRFASGRAELTLTDPVEIKIQPKDKVSILVNSQGFAPRDQLWFNPAGCFATDRRGGGSSVPIGVCPAILCDSKGGEYRFPRIGRNT